MMILVETRHCHDLWVHNLFWNKPNWWLDVLGFYPQNLHNSSLWFPHIWHQQLHLKIYKTSTLSFHHHTFFLICLIRLSKIKNIHHFEASTSMTPIQEVRFLSDIFLTAWIKKEKINVKKSMSQGFLLCGQPQDEICHEEVKIWPFAHKLTQPTWFSLQYPLQYLLYILYLVFSFIWRLSIVQSRNISSFWIFYVFFL